MDQEIAAAWDAKDHVPPPDAEMIDVLSKVIEITGVSGDLLVSKVRRQPVAYARQIAMWQLHRAGYSLPRIGKFLGNRDHTTVLHGIRRVESRMEQTNGR